MSCSIATSAAGLDARPVHWQIQAMEWTTRKARYKLGTGGKVAFAVTLAMISYVPIYFAARQLGAPAIGDVFNRLLDWLR